MTVRVIGLDLSVAATGLAKPDGATVTIRPHAGAGDPARRLNEIVARLDPYLRLGVDLAVIEGYSRGGPGGPYVMLRLAEVGGAVRLRLFELGIPFIEIPPSQLKKFAVGYGGSRQRPVTKADVVEAARLAGVSAANDNEADAFWLHAMGRSEFSETWEPAYRSAELLEVRAQVRASIRWPSLDVSRA